MADVDARPPHTYLSAEFNTQGPLGTTSELGSRDGHSAHAYSSNPLSHRQPMHMMQGQLHQATSSSDALRSFEDSARHPTYDAQMEHSGAALGSGPSGVIVSGGPPRSTLPGRAEDVAAYARVNGDYQPSPAHGDELLSAVSQATAFSEGTLHIPSDLPTDADLAAASRLQFPDVPAVLLEQPPEYEYSAHTRANVFLEPSLAGFVGGGYEGGDFGWADTSQTGAGYPLPLDAYHSIPSGSASDLNPDLASGLAYATAGAPQADPRLDPHYLDASLAAHGQGIPHIPSDEHLSTPYLLEGPSRHPYDGQGDYKRRRTSPPMTVPSNAAQQSPRYMQLHGSISSPRAAGLGAPGMGGRDHQKQLSVASLPGHPYPHAASPPPLSARAPGHSYHGSWSRQSGSSFREEQLASSQHRGPPPQDTRGGVGAAGRHSPGHGGASDWSSAGFARPSVPLSPPQGQMHPPASHPGYHQNVGGGHPPPTVPSQGYHASSSGHYGLGGGMQAQTSSMHHTGPGPASRMDPPSQLLYDTEEASASRSFRRDSSSSNLGNESDDESIEDAPPPNEKAVALAQAAIKGGNGTAQQADMLAALNKTMAWSLDTDGVARCPFPDCTKTFAKNRSYNLKTHLRSHSQLKPFACSSCPRAFSRKHDLERHARVHSGDKPYICEVCGRGFPRSDALRRHWRVEKECGDRASEIEAGQPLPSVAPGSAAVLAPVKTMLPGQPLHQRYTGPGPLPGGWSQGGPHPMPPPPPPSHHLGAGPQPHPHHLHQYAPVMHGHPPSLGPGPMHPASMPPPHSHPSSTGLPPSHHLGVKRGRDDW
ncbi:unnamed protein product [Parajaminaea phylloscopi]